MQKFDNLYTFIDFAKGNRKYPENTANNLKSALKIFEKVLTEDELNSVSLLEDRIEEIFINVINDNKNKSIGSLNTYKARVLRVLGDYKKYGANPSKIQSWVIKIKKSTPLLIKQDKTDKNQINLSNAINTPVDNIHKIELALENGAKAIIAVPKNINPKEAEIIKAVIDSLTNYKPSA